MPNYLNSPNSVKLRRLYSSTDSYIDADYGWKYCTGYVTCGVEDFTGLHG